MGACEHGGIGAREHGGMGEEQEKGIWSPGGFSATCRFPELEPQFAFLKRLITFNYKTICDLGGIGANDQEELSLKRALLFLCQKAVKTGSAAATLLERGFVEDANVSLRSMLEILIDVRFIRQDPRRATDFWDYLPYARFKRFQAMERCKTQYGPSPSTFADYGRVKKQYERLRPRFNGRGDWCELDRCSRANKVGLGDAYELMYRPFCDYGHSNPLIAVNYSRLTDEGLEIFRRAQSASEFRLALVQAANILHQVLDQLSQGFEVDLGAELKSFEEDLSNVFDLRPDKPENELNENA